jgi:hypothetical protein
MTTLLRNPLRHVLPVGALVLGAAFTQPALAVDWNAVPGKEVVLFYPGQASFEWALTKSDHSGATKFREGKNCKECHDGEQKQIGDLIVSGKKLEPDPIPGKRGSIKTTIKTAHDDENLYVRIEWPAAPPSSGPMMDPKFEEKATMMFDDGEVVEAKRAGCWGTCHDDAIGMASAPPNEKITKYLARSRTKITRHGGDNNFKSAAEIEGLLKDGIFMEYWQARLNQGAAAVPVDGYILDKRHENDSPMVSANAEFANGNWSVVLSRKLVVGKPRHKDIVPGKTYYLGFAIHDAHAAHRFHQVSFGYTLVLDKGEADFVATKR